jgi:hypothetical protein
MRGGMPEVHERGQEPVDEHQPVLRTRAHSTLPRPGRKLGLMPFVPQRGYHSDEFSDHVGRQARDPPVSDDRCTRGVPHHTIMIDDQKLDASPPTVHELVKVCCRTARKIVQRFPHEIDRHRQSPGNWTKRSSRRAGSWRETSADLVLQQALATPTARTRWQLVSDTSRGIHENDPANTSRSHRSHCPRPAAVLEPMGPPDETTPQALRVNPAR